nr:uncharacterized protein LOC124814362 [Hydra vulgaris]
MKRNRWTLISMVGSRQEKIKSTYVPPEFFKLIGPSKTGKSGLLFECRMKNCPRQRTFRALRPIFMPKNYLSNLRRHIKNYHGEDLGVEMLSFNKAVEAGRQSNKKQSTLDVHFVVKNTKRKVNKQPITQKELDHNVLVNCNLISLYLPC